MNLRSAAFWTMRKVETLAMRTRIGWSVDYDAPVSDQDAAQASELVMYGGDYPRLLFWTAAAPPQNFIREDIPPDDRALVVYALVRGWAVRHYLGYADCRLCGERLGTKDMAVHGMIYPEKAEHYLMEHEVWTPGCDELLRRLQSKSLT